MPVYSHLATASVVAAMIVGWLRYRDLPRSLKYLEWLAAVNVIVALTELVLGYYHTNNLWILHLSTAAEYIFLFFVFYFWMEDRLSRSILKLCLLVFILLWAVSKFTFEPFRMADDLTASISKVMQIVFSTFLLLHIVRESNLVWLKDPRFWTASGTIIYSAGSLFIFSMFTNMLQVSAERLVLVWYVNWTLIILANLLYIRAFLCRN
jgi:hypothetical protein